MRKRAELRPYQVRTAEYLYGYPEAFAIMKMGSGKTAATATAIADGIEDKLIRHAVLLAPPRVRDFVWPVEFEAWEHLSGLRYAVLSGGPDERLQVLKQAHKRDVTLCSIDSTQWLCEQLAGLPDDHPLFDCLVIDEVSKFKDPKSKRGKALFGQIVRFRNRWALTGTPMPNSMLDLFGPAKLITQGRLWGKSYYKWRQSNFYPLDRNGYRWDVLPHKRTQLLTDIGSISITLAEADMPELPDLNVVVDEVELPPTARQAYKTMQRDLFARLKLEDVAAASKAVATGKLAQIANGFMYGDAGNEVANHLHTEKLEWIRELVDELDGEPLIVVYDFREDLRRLQAAFPAMPHLGSGVTTTEARRAIEAWNRGALPLFALHPAAGGHGLNLQAGGARMAFYGLPWSAELYDQTVARIWRPGQSSRKVTLHLVQARHTVDAMKRARVVDKLSAQAAFEAYLRSQGLAGGNRP